MDDEKATILKNVRAFLGPAAQNWWKDWRLFQWIVWNVTFRRT